MVLGEMRTVAARVRDAGFEVRMKRLDSFVFVHINKTGGSSVAKALRLSRDHRSALEWKVAIGDAAWRRRFTFSFVRNPWDKVLSQYAFQSQRGNRRFGSIEFNTWVRRAYGAQDPEYYGPRMFLPQVDWISDEHGRTLVDLVGRFERLEADFRQVCDHLGRDVQLPHMKRSRHDDYRDAYEPDTMRIVRDWFSGDIDRFGYAF